MNYANRSLLFAVILFSLICFAGCSDEKSSVKKIYKNYLEEEKIKKEKLSADLARMDEATREKYVAIVDKCIEKFDECLTKCDTDACEDKCMKTLAECEKDLPEELKSLR